MLRQASITIPAYCQHPGDVDQSTTNPQRAALTAKLVEYFGGCTVSQAEGFWTDADGVIVREPVYTLTFACAPWATSVDSLGHYQSELTNVIIRYLALDHVGRGCNQAAVYYVLPTGEVCIATRGKEY